ncbi:short-chain dehydrogenase TIC 32, chloroplastic-like [Trifolium pratense]|uniref:short-chain dehydrogenase TIC 32, chloroplastic-like n=1 Tax=Trifolium pratense TaxID=57577 RepID=UPI001E6942E1|nr:short-chain dehydrogenase TIC 32, chloroplastic-like [Trifolium pratense]
MWLFGRKGPSGSGFSASSTAEDVTQEIDATGLTAIVTGATSGIGIETARVLALRGVHVVMGVRNMEAGKEIKETILRNNSTAKIVMMELDLSSMESVRKFTSQFNSRSLPLNILMNHGNTIQAFQRQYRITICDKPYR